MSSAPDAVWPLRLRRRHIISVGIIDTRSVLDRYLRWRQWSLHHCSHIDRLLARLGDVGDASDASDVVTQVPGQLPVWFRDTTLSMPVGPLEPLHESVSELTSGRTGDTDRSELVLRIRRSPPPPDFNNDAQLVKRLPVELVEESQAAPASVRLVRPDDTVPRKRPMPSDDQSDRLTADPRSRRQRLAISFQGSVPTDNVGPWELKNRLVSRAKRPLAAADRSPPFLDSGLAREKEWAGPAGKVLATPVTLDDVNSSVSRIGSFAVSRPVELIWRAQQPPAGVEERVSVETRMPGRPASFVRNAWVDSPPLPTIAPGGLINVARPEPAMSPVQPPAGVNSVDLRDLVDRVSDRILRRIAIDIERRGGRSWP